MLYNVAPSVDADYTRRTWWVTSGFHQKSKGKLEAVAAVGANAEIWELNTLFELRLRNK